MIRTLPQDFYILSNGCQTPIRLGLCFLILSFFWGPLRAESKSMDLDQAQGIPEILPTQKDSPARDFQMAEEILNPEQTIGAAPAIDYVTAKQLLHRAA